MVDILTWGDLTELAGHQNKNVTSHDDDTSGERRKNQIIRNSRASKRAFMMNMLVAGEQYFWEYTVFNQQRRMHVFCIYFIYLRTSRKRTLISSVSTSARPAFS